MVLSSLCESCLNGDIDRVKKYLNKTNINEIIIKYDENENCNDQWTLIQSKGLTPIICAIQNNHLSIVQYLFQQGANIYLLQPLKIACEYKHSTIIDYLLNIFSVKCESITSAKVTPSSSLSLWYENAASEWLESLPIGNGYMGGMIYGGFPRETIQLNSDTLWAGCPHDYSNQGALEYLPQIRQLIDDNKWIDAQTLLTQHFFGKPIGQAPYQTVGNLFIDFFGQSSTISINQYQRELNLEKAITTTTYSTDNGINYQRTCFAS